MLFQHHKEHIQQRDSTSPVELKSDGINVKRRIKQGDSPSPKLFTLDLEDAMRTIDWKEGCFDINGEKFTHLCFTGDVVVFGQTKEELKGTMENIYNLTRNMGQST